MEHQDRVAVVTGGGKGIGRGTVEVLVTAGAKVIVLDTDAESGQQTADALGDQVHFIACNVAEEQAVIDALRQGAERFGKISYLVNNAGVQRYAPVTETTEAMWDLIMDVNVKGSFFCAKHAIPYMQQEGKGVVVNVSSVQAMLTQGNVAAYTTSKTALLGLTRSIAVDYAPRIRCVAVCPGSVDTPLLRWGIQQSPDPEAVMQECIDMHLTDRIGTSTEIGEFISFLCSDKAGFMTGQAYRIDGGLGVMIPGSQRD